MEPNYPDNVRPDVLYKVPWSEGELRLNPGTDFLHYFPWLDRWILKYWNLDVEPPAMCNFLLPNTAAEYLISLCDLDICSRTFITAEEREHLLDFDSDQLDDSWLDETP